MMMGDQMNQGRCDAGDVSRHPLPPIPQGGSSATPAATSSPGQGQSSHRQQSGCAAQGELQQLRPWPTLTTDQKADLIIALVGDRVLAEARRIRREKGEGKLRESG